MAIKKISITIGKLEEFFKEGKKLAFELDKGIKKRHIPTLTFEDLNTYKKILTERRIELLKTIAAKKPRSIKELAVLIKRDFKNVYEDIKILENVGLIKLKKSDFGLIPVAIYDEINIHIRIPLEAFSS